MSNTGLSPLGYFVFTQCFGAAPKKAATVAGSSTSSGQESWSTPASDCACVSPRGAPFAFGVIDARIAHVEVHGPGPRTEEGVGVGSLLADVQRAYAGRIELSSDGRALTFEPRADWAIVFETDGSRVTRFRAGRLGTAQRTPDCP